MLSVILNLATLVVGNSAQQNGCEGEQLNKILQCHTHTLYRKDVHTHIMWLYSCRRYFLSCETLTIFVPPASFFSPVTSVNVPCIIALAANIYMYTS